MNRGRYILDGHTPVAESNLLRWAVWFETADRTVEKTYIQDCEISTVFLGLDHQWLDGPPILFETMIFGGKLDGECWRYSTWEEAREGHEAAVEKVKEMEG